MTGWHKTSRHERGYGAAWVKLRARILDRDMHLCQPCLRNGRPTKADAVDHIVPKSKGGTDDPANLEAICNDCHAAKTAKDEGRKARTKMGFDAGGNPIWPV